MPEPSGNDDLIPLAELKPVLAQSKRRPVSCAVGLSRDKQAVVLLDRKLKPRKMLAELKGRAKDAGLELDMTSLRFGRASLQADDGTAVFTVNKAAPAALEAGLTRRLRPAGVRKVQVGVDEALNGEEDDAGGADAGGADVEAGQDAGGQARQDGAGRGGAEAGRAAAPAGPGRDGRGTSDAGGVANEGGAGEGGPSAAEPGRADAARRLGSLVRRASALLQSNLPGADAVRAAARAGQASLKAGDLAGAGQAADTLERLLDGFGGTPDAAGPGGPVQPDASGASGTTPPGAAGPGAADAAVGAAPSVPGGRNATAAPAGAGPTGRASAPPPAAVLAKGGQVWDAMCAKLERDVDKVAAEVANQFGPGPQADQVRSGLQPILHGLDVDLSKALRTASGMSDLAARAKAVQDAHAIIGRYRAFLAGNPIVALLDRNPFHTVAVRDTVEGALARLSRALGDGVSGTQPGQGA